MDWPYAITIAMVGLLGFIGGLASFRRTCTQCAGHPTRFEAVRRHVRPQATGTTPGSNNRNEIGEVAR